MADIIIITISIKKNVFFLDDKWLVALSREAIVINLKINIIVLSGIVNAKASHVFLQRHLLPKTPSVASRILFQQNNVVGHTANTLNALFFIKEFTILNRPAKSDGLNIIENLWGNFPREISKKRRQKFTAAEIKQNTTEELKNIF